MVFRQLNKKFKSFQYQTDLEWAGDRAGMIHSEGKPAFRVSSPPEFKGESGVWTPEDLFVASIESCAMTTFLAFAERAKLPIVSYTSHAEGFLENVEGSYQFVKIILRPTIVISDPKATDLVCKTFEESNRKCFIANSIRAEVLTEPKIVEASSRIEQTCGT
jgi:organic hydroperoxide reductase OsmC/OhrA